VRRRSFGTGAFCGEASELAGGRQHKASPHKAVGDGAQQRAGISIVVVAIPARGTDEISLPRLDQPGCDVTVHGIHLLVGADPSVPALRPS
jgi:hypothetical protein